MTEIPPASHQLELSVFGPGVGECVVAHLGNGAWIVVDSCIDRQTRRPVALDYLESLGVNAATDVKLVVATHWHDDHIEGLGEILAVATSARFVNSAAHALKDLVHLVTLDAGSSSTATREFSTILKILKGRRLAGETRDAVGPVQAIANRTLLSLGGPERSFDASVTSLSPSDGVFNLAETELHYSLEQVTQRRRPILQGPNQLCVVLWLKVGVFNVLLGADLEHTSGETQGWKAIVNSDERPGGRAGFFKIAHHGSEDADCPGCWTHMLTDQPLAIVTPYTRSRLPRAADLLRFCERTKKVYVTSNPNGYSVPRRDNAVEKTLREMAATRRALAGPMGHLRVRCDARDPSQEPLLTLRNGAKRQCA